MVFCKAIKIYTIDDTTPIADVDNEPDQPRDQADDTSLAQEQQDTNWLLDHKGKIAIGAAALAMATPHGRAQVKTVTTKAKNMAAQAQQAIQYTKPHVLNIKIKYNKT